MRHAAVLVIHDEEFIPSSLTERLKAKGYQVIEAQTGAAALEKLPAGVDLVLLGYKRPGSEGVGILRRIREFDQDILVILLTASASAEADLEAMKLEADHFANQPFNLDELLATVERALETTRLRREVRHYRTTAARAYNLHSIVGSSESMTTLRHLVAKVATSSAPTVLVTGESGTGKDLVAKIIHYTSDRAARPFMTISCSVPPENLLETELFGHESSAFTDARVQKRGVVETADGGTVLLDGISDMTPGLQAKLLRFLEAKAFTRVGGTAEIRVDVRVVAATNRNLEEEVAKGRFRSDLYHRLNVLPISLPPLRTHSEDVPLLVEYFIDGFNTELRKRVLGASPAVYTLLERYAWPGNIRELRNVIERVMLLSDAQRLEPNDFAAGTRTAGSAEDFELPATGVDLEDLERSLVVQALRRSKGNQTRAAALLGLNRDQIRYRIEKFGLSVSP